MPVGAGAAWPAVQGLRVERAHGVAFPGARGGEGPRGGLPRSSGQRGPTGWPSCRAPGERGHGQSQWHVGGSEEEEARVPRALTAPHVGELDWGDPPPRQSDSRGDGLAGRSDRRSDPGLCAPRLAFRLLRSCRRVCPAAGRGTGEPLAGCTVSRGNRDRGERICHQQRSANSKDSRMAPSSSRFCCG